MRTTPIEVIWLASSLVGFWVCLRNYKTYRDDYIEFRKHDPENGDSYRTNALLNTFRLVSMSGLLFVSCTAAALTQPVSEAWRTVNQLVLTGSVISMTIIAVVIRRAVQRRDH